MMGGERGRLGLEPLEVGRALARLRRLAKMTQAEVAAAMGTTQSAISRAETGQVMPSVGFLERYAWAAGRMLAMDIGPMARQRGIRWVSAAQGTAAAEDEVVDPRADAAERIRLAGERLNRGEITAGEWAIERTETEFELAEKLQAQI